MAKQAKDTEDKSLTRADIRSALSDDASLRDTSIVTPIIMGSDLPPENQSSQTVRFALNAIIEDRYDANRLQNEESNELCIELLPKTYDTYEVKVLGCCRNLVKIYYVNAGTLSNNLKNAMDSVSKCDVEGNPIWKIHGTDITGDYNTIYNYISTNIDNYTISIVNCKQYNLHTITFYSCCNDYVGTLEFSDSIVIDDYLIRDFFIESECIKSFFLGINGVLGILKREGGQEVEILSEYPILITNDAEIRLLCTEKGCGEDNNPDIKILNSNIVEVSVGGDPVDYIQYDSIILGIDGLAFTLDMGLSIIVDGITLSYGDQWVLNADGTITIEYPLNMHSVIRFYAKNLCNNYFERNIFLTDTDVDLRMGEDIIGYITRENSFLICPSSSIISIGNEDSTGLTGRIYGNKQITGYKIRNSRGMSTEIYTDTYTFNALYNQEIELIFKDVEK